MITCVHCIALLISYLFIIKYLEIEIEKIDFNNIVELIQTITKIQIIQCLSRLLSVGCVCIEMSSESRTEILSNCASDTAGTTTRTLDLVNYVASEPELRDGIAVFNLCSVKIAGVLVNCLIRCFSFSASVFVTARNTIAFDGTMHHVKN